VPNARPGGRTARTRRTILDATVALLEEHGARDLTVAGIAARSGAHPSTIYRRWPSLDRLVFEALLDTVDTAIPIPDLGAFPLDVRALLGSLAAFYAEPLGRVIGALAVAPADDAGTERIRMALWSARIDAVGAIVRRAVARGELPGDTDAVAAVHVLLGPLHLSAVSLGVEPTPALLDALTDVSVRALGAETKRPPARVSRGARRRGR
jgi:AcrR family transcriptional regulator